MDAVAKNLIINGVKSAGLEIMKYFGQDHKSSRYKITSFDYGIFPDKEANRIILNHIQKSKLDCQIISEESGLTGTEKADYKIYVDSLDGSVNFSRGIPIFCVGLGVCFKDEPILGVIYDPSLDELFVAEKGKGASVNGRKISPKTYDQNILVNLEWFGAPQYETIVAKLKKAGIRARTVGSGVLALCYGVIGRGDAAILINNSPWDIAPGMVFAKELGYTIKQMDRSDIDLTKRKMDIVAAPKDLFEKIIAALK